MDYDDVNALLKEVSLGNRESLQRLYSATSPKLFGICLRLLGSRAEAEDTLQDVYIKVWHKAYHFDAHKGNGQAWLSVIARNTALDRLRARKPDATFGAENEAELLNVVDQSADPEQHAGQSLMRQHLEACLSELPSDRAQAVRAAYLEGLTYQDLATAFDIPLNTMRTWLRRSLLSLRDCLSVHDPEKSS